MGTTMFRLKATISTIRALFAKSRNQCAFPGCRHVLVNDMNVFVAQICHIEAAASGGPRYNSCMTVDACRSFENLILLCYQHHVEVDRDPNFYGVVELQSMKRNHEVESAASPFLLQDDTLREIVDDIGIFWTRLDNLHRLEHHSPEISVPIDSEASATDLIGAVRSLLAHLRSFTDDLAVMDRGLEAEFRALANQLGWDTCQYDAMEYCHRPFYQRNWEVHNLAVQNCFIRLETLLMQMEVHVLDMRLLQDPNDQAIRRQLTEARIELESFARSAGLAD